MSRPPLVALVYRQGKGCRQYPMSCVDELDSFTRRSPYRYELLMVLPVKDGKFVEVERTFIPAHEAVSFLLSKLGASNTPAEPLIPEGDFPMPAEANGLAENKGGLFA